MNPVCTHCRRWAKRCNQLLLWRCPGCKREITDEAIYQVLGDPAQTAGRG